MTVAKRKDLITRPTLLTKDYLPADMGARRRQIKELKTTLQPAKRGHKPIHSWVYGPPGSGKTTTVKYLLNKWESDFGVGGIVINCWTRTFYSVVDEILNSLKVLGSEKRETSFKVEKLRKSLGDKPFIIALDEVDKLPNQERDAMLYNLNFGQVGLICIGHGRKSLTLIDERVRSRLNPQQIKFTPYRVKELVGILKERAEGALAPGCWDKGRLLTIARLSRGDARVALQTLRNAARLAENRGDETIQDEHIQKGFNGTRGLKKSYRLESLTEHHKLLFRIIKESEGIKSGNLQNEYLKRCKQKGLQPMAQRTVDKYLKELIVHQLVEKKRAKARGRVYNYRIVD